MKDQISSASPLSGPSPVLSLGGGWPQAGGVGVSLALAPSLYQDQRRCACVHHVWTGKRPACCLRPKQGMCWDTKAAIYTWDTVTHGPCLSLCPISSSPILSHPLPYSFLSLVHLWVAMLAQRSTTSILSPDLVLLQVHCLQIYTFFLHRKASWGFSISLSPAVGSCGVYYSENKLQSFLQEDVEVGSDGEWLWFMLIVPSPVGKAIVFHQGLRQAKPVRQVLVMLFCCMLPDTGIDSSLETREG